jgi:nicotinamidase-related amidase
VRLPSSTMSPPACAPSSSAPSPPSKTTRPNALSGWPLWCKAGEWGSWVVQAPQFFYTQHVLVGLCVGWLGEL